MHRNGSSSAAVRWRGRSPSPSLKHPREPFSVDCTDRAYPSLKQDHINGFLCSSRSSQNVWMRSVLFTVCHSDIVIILYKCIACICSAMSTQVMFVMLDTSCQLSKKADADSEQQNGQEGVALQLLLSLKVTGSPSEFTKRLNTQTFWHQSKGKLHDEVGAKLLPTAHCRSLWSITWCSSIPRSNSSRRTRSKEAADGCSAQLVLDMHSTTSKSTSQNSRGWYRYWLWGVETSRPYLQWVHIMFIFNDDILH